MVNVKAASKIISELTLMRFFPSEDPARTALVRIICEMAESEDQIRWLVGRMINLYPEWPGPREMRACFCSKFKPKDGIEAHSQVHLDGIPSEKRLEAPPRLALPPGCKVTADPKIDAVVCEAFAMMPKMLPAKTPPTGEDARFAKVLHESQTAPCDREPLPGPTPQIITQADIDDAVRKLREDKEAKLV